MTNNVILFPTGEGAKPHRVSELAWWAAQYEVMPTTPAQEKDDPFGVLLIAALLALAGYAVFKVAFVLTTVLEVVQP